MFKKALAAAAIAVVAIFAAPAAAQAAYIDGSLVSAPSSIAPGGSGTITFAAGAFTPGEQVQFTLTGENGAGATLSSVVAAVSSTSTTKTAASDGSISVTVTLPANATGSYTLTATGLSSGNIANVTFAAAASSGAGTGSESGVGSGSSDGSLPNTGAMDPTLGIWAGGGLLALGAAFVIVLTVVRRQKATN